MNNIKLIVRGLILLTFVVAMPCVVEAGDDAAPKLHDPDEIVIYDDHVGGVVTLTAYDDDDGDTADLSFLMVTNDYFEIPTLLTGEVKIKSTADLRGAPEQVNVTVTVVDDFTEASSNWDFVQHVIPINIRRRIAMLDITGILSST